jgi:hypothetical protein
VPAPEQPAVTPIAVDGFERSVATGLGAAQTGGSWTVQGSASVAGGAGRLAVAAPGGSTVATLNSVSAADVALQATVSLDQAPTGGGTYAYLVGRRVAGSTYYRGVVRVQANGAVTLGVSRVVSGVETTLKTVALPGVTYTPGTALVVRLDLAGAGTTTLNARAWVAGTPEPTGWQVTATDTTAALQAAGGLGLSTYVSGSATAVPVVLTVDDVWAGPAGSARPAA